MKHFLSRPLLLKVFFLGLYLVVVRALSLVHETSAQTPNGLIDLVLVPYPAIAQAGDLVTLAVVAYPNGNQLSAADIRIGFDPDVLTLLQPPSVSTAAGFTFLPHCSEGQNPPCDATSSATTASVSFTVGVICDATGCNLPGNINSFELSRVHFVASGDVGSKTEVNLNTPNEFSLTAAFEASDDATRVLSPALVSVSPCGLAHDYAPNGEVDVTDIMTVAGRWNANHGTNNYTAQQDSDLDGDIDIGDIQRVANAWNTRCP